MNPSERDTLQLVERQFEHATALSQRFMLRDLLVPAAAPDPPTPAAPDPTDLDAILNNVAKAPGSTSIATVPTTPDTLEYQLLAQIQTLDSYVSILTALCVYSEHPQPYDITDPVQASQFTRAIAKWRNYVLTGGKVTKLAGYLPTASILTQSVKQSVTSADLHLEFLTALFGAFGFGAATLAELDSILTTVVNTLQNLKLSFESQSDTVDHFLTYYYFQTVAGTGGKGEPPALYEVNVRTFYLHVGQATWTASIGKQSVQSFEFDMNYFDMSATMAAALVASDMPVINAAINTLTGKDAATINQMANMKAIHADPQPSQ